MLPPGAGGSFGSEWGRSGESGGESARRRRKFFRVFFAVFKGKTVIFRFKNFLAAEGGQKILGGSLVRVGGSGGEKILVRDPGSLPPGPGGSKISAPPQSGGEWGGVSPPFQKGVCTPLE